MKHSIKIGLGFGLASGVITTLGLMVGLYSGTYSKSVVLGGILTIAIADALSDALGIHISEESEGRHSIKEIWLSTISTFVSKFIFALTFVVPVLLLRLQSAVIISVCWGFLLLTVFSFKLAKEQEKDPWKIIGEHILIAITVIIITYYIGHWINLIFK